MIARLVLRTEDLLQRAAVGLMLRLGRPVRVEVFPGFGADGWVEVRGRVLVGSATVAPRPATVTTCTSLRANLSQFLTVEVPSAAVRVDLGGRSEVLRTDREGYLGAVLRDVPLPAGRHTVTLTPLEPQGVAAHGTVHVPDPAADVVVVSDIDDTIIDSGIAHGLVATVTTALLRDASTRVPLEGAAELYRAMAHDADGPERPFIYLSTSPWNLVRFLQRFLEQHRFPAGPLLLTDWGPGAGGLLRVGTQQHKLTALRQLAELLPRPRFVLVGDNGQQDADIYRTFALEHPGRVAAIYIRLAADDPVRQQRLSECARALGEAGVPFVVAPDSAGMLRHAQEHGLAVGPGSAEVG
jgi:phosphatidate phosphatase APP1